MGWLSARKPPTYGARRDWRPSSGGSPLTSRQGGEGRPGARSFVSRVAFYLGMHLISLGKRGESDTKLHKGERARKQRGRMSKVPQAYWTCLRNPCCVSAGQATLGRCQTQACRHARPRRRLNGQFLALVSEVPRCAPVNHAPRFRLTGAGAPCDDLHWAACAGENGPRRCTLLTSLSALCNPQKWLGCKLSVRG